MSFCTTLKNYLMISMKRGENNMPLVRMEYTCHDCKFKSGWTTLALIHKLFSGHTIEQNMHEVK